MPISSSASCSCVLYTVCGHAPEQPPLRPAPSTRLPQSHIPTDGTLLVNSFVLLHLIEQYGYKNIPHRPCHLVIVQVVHSNKLTISCTYPYHLQEQWPSRPPLFCLPPRGSLWSFSRAAEGPRGEPQRSEEPREGSTDWRWWVLFSWPVPRPAKILLCVRQRHNILLCIVRNWSFLFSVLPILALSATRCTMLCHNQLFFS